MRLIKDLMRRKVVTVDESADVKTICKLLAKHVISGLPVVTKKDKKLIGFVSERDVIGAVPKPNFMSKTAKQLMTRKPVTINEDAPITHASKIFSEQKYRQLPVVKNGKLVGIITRRDMLNQMLAHYY